MYMQHNIYYATTLCLDLIKNFMGNLEC